MCVAHSTVSLQLYLYNLAEITPVLRVKFKVMYEYMLTELMLSYNLILLLFTLIQEVMFKGE